MESNDNQVSGLPGQDQPQSEDENQQQIKPSYDTQDSVSSSETESVNDMNEGVSLPTETSQEEESSTPEPEVASSFVSAGETDTLNQAGVVNNDSQPKPITDITTSQTSPAVSTVEETPPSTVRVETSPSSEIHSIQEQTTSTTEPIVVSSGGKDSEAKPEKVPKTSSKFGKSGRKHFWRNVVIACGILIVLMGGGALALFTVYLPSQPWYILDNALKNTMSQDQFTANIVANSSGGKTTLPVQITSTSAVNLKTKQINEDLGLNLGFGGNTSIPIQGRLVNGNLYFKVSMPPSLLNILQSASSGSGSSNSNLSNVSVLNLFPPQLIKLINNHWLSVGKAMLDQSKPVKCLLNGNWTLSSSDTNYLTSSYMKKPFFKVNTLTSDTVGGVASDKLSVTMNDNEAANYLKGIGNLQAYKNYQECLGGKNSQGNFSSLADGKQTPLTIWVDKSNNLINKVELNSIPGSKFSGSIVATINYNNVTVSAPANSESVLQLFSQLGQSFKAKLGNLSKVQ